jgi:hypothetical protein
MARPARTVRLTETEASMVLSNCAESSRAPTTLPVSDVLNDDALSSELTNSWLHGQSTWNDADDWASVILVVPSRRRAKR